MLEVVVRTIADAEALIRLRHLYLVIQRWCLRQFRQRRLEPRVAAIEIGIERIVARHFGDRVFGRPVRCVHPVHARRLSAEIRRRAAVSDEAIDERRPSLGRAPAQRGCGDNQQPHRTPTKDPLASYSPFRSRSLRRLK